jgi:hypothetical protein
VQEWLKVLTVRMKSKAGFHPFKVDQILLRVYHGRGNSRCIAAIHMEHSNTSSRPPTLSQDRRTRLKMKESKLQQNSEEADESWSA